MRRRWIVAAGLAGMLAVIVAACGSSSHSPSGSEATAVAKMPLKPGENPAGEQLYGKRRGGTLTVYSSSDFAHLDPGQSYYALDYAVMYATQRPLFTYPPNSEMTLVPDLATAVPTLANGGITDGGELVTVHIQPDVRFSPPVNRVVTSSDVAYALERGFNPNVAGEYLEYFKDIVGASTAKGGPIAGITTPNPTTIVFHLTHPTAEELIGALSLPASAPVPEPYAAPMDRHTPTTYGSIAEVATGPYMIKAHPNGDFAGYGYEAGKSLTLVRNPNWNPSSYTSLYKPPAYLNQVDVQIGADASVIGPYVLRGTDSIQLDAPTAAVVQLAYQHYPSQVTFTPGAEVHWVALDNAVAPFDNVWIRRAVYAGLDRAAIVKVRGGALTGEPGTHFIYPGNLGFQQAGGYAGPAYPWNKDVNGDLALAEQYMKKAGYPSGKYTGSRTVSIVGANSGNDPAVSQIFNADLTALGFKTKVSLVSQSVVYSKYCGTPKLEISACPTVAWIRDFADPLTTLYEAFYGPAISPTGNANWSQVNNPQVNADMVKAINTVNPTAAIDEWAKVDDLLVDDAVAIPDEFDNEPNIRSADVLGVNDIWDDGTWDFSFTSLTNP